MANASNIIQWALFGNVSNRHMHKIEGTRWPMRLQLVSVRSYNKSARGLPNPALLSPCTMRSSPSPLPAS